MWLLQRQVHLNRIVLFPINGPVVFCCPESGQTTIRPAPLRVWSVCPFVQGKDCGLSKWRHAGIETWTTFVSQVGGKNGKVESSLKRGNFSTRSSSTFLISNHRKTSPSSSSFSSKLTHKKRSVDCLCCLSRTNASYGPWRISEPPFLTPNSKGSIGVQPMGFQVIRGVLTCIPQCDKRGLVCRNCCSFYFSGERNSPDYSRISFAH